MQLPTMRVSVMGLKSMVGSTAAGGAAAAAMAAAAIGWCARPPWLLLPTPHNAVFLGGRGTLQRRECITGPRPKMRSLVACRHRLARGSVRWTLAAAPPAPPRPPPIPLPACAPADTPPLTCALVNRARQPLLLLLLLVPYSAASLASIAACSTPLSSALPSSAPSRSPVAASTGACLSLQLRLVWIRSTASPNCIPPSQYR